MVDNIDQPPWKSIVKSIVFIGGALIIIWFILLPVLNLRPDSDEPNIDEAEELHQQGKLDLALIEYTDAINKGVDLASAYAGRGSTLMKLRRFREAINDYSKSLEYEKNADVLANRCNAYRLTASIQLAHQDCVDAIARDDQNIQAHIAFAMLLVEEELISKAREEIILAIEIDPASAEAQFALSQINMAVGDTSAAIEALSKCIKIDMFDPVCYWHRGFLYSSLGQIDLAVIDMQAVIDMGIPEIHGQLMLEAGTVLRQYGVDPDR